MNIIAPCPKKPSSLLQQDWNASSSTLVQQDEVDDACYELRQILLQSQKQHVCTTGTYRLDEPIIPRTNNPLPLDSSFIPLQAVSHHFQHTLDTTHYKQPQRPRSLSVGNSRPMANLVH